jgi:hypothetical protein
MSVSAPGPTALPPTAPPRWLLAVVLAVAALAFLPALPIGFLADDFVYIARFYTMPWSAWPQFFTHEWSGGVWGQPLKELRPFAALSFMIDARLWGGNATGYRLVNLALHLAATGLVVRLAWRYAQALPARHSAPAAPLIAGLVFAVHPAHVETVAWITGRADLLGSVAALAFLLAGEIYSERGPRTSAALCLAALLVGVFTKEFCLTVPPLLILRWLLLDPRAGRAIWQRRAWLIAGALAVTAVYVVARRAAFGSDPTTGFFGWNDGPAWNRQAGYAGWIVPILPFTTGHEWAAPPSLAVLRTLWIVLSAAVGLALGVAMLRRAPWAGAVFFGGFWWFATTLGLFVVVYFSPRHLYLPSAGVAIGLGLALNAGRSRRLLAAVVVAWCLAAHFAALRPWREAGRISREVIAAVDAHLAGAGENTIALIAVPETFGHVLLWAWSSPQALGAPFLVHPRTPAQVIERPVNYVRSESWVADHRPVETVRAAGRAVAVFVDADGRVHHRLVPRAELTTRADELARLVALGLNPDNLTAWLKSCALP